MLWMFPGLGCVYPTARGFVKRVARQKCADVPSSQWATDVTVRFGNFQPGMNFQYTAAIQAFVGRPLQAPPPPTQSGTDRDKLHSHLSGVTAEHVFSQEPFSCGVGFFVFCCLCSLGGGGVVVESLLCCLHWWPLRLLLVTNQQSSWSLHAPR